MFENNGFLEGVHVFASTEQDALGTGVPFGNPAEPVARRIFALR